MQRCISRQMNPNFRRLFVAVAATITFTVPIIQFAIGINFVVNDGETNENPCPIARDLPLLMEIGGIFLIMFLGTAYSLLAFFFSSKPARKDVDGQARPILIGLFVSMLFSH